MIEQAGFVAAIAALQAIITAFFAIRYAVVQTKATREKTQGEQNTLLISSMINRETVTEHRIKELELGRQADHESADRREAGLEQRISNLVAEKLLLNAKIVTLVGERDTAIANAGKFEAELETVRYDLVLANTKIDELEDRLTRAYLRIESLEKTNDDARDNTAT